MDAKRVPVAEVARPAAAAAGTRDTAPREHSWLVFRLGPHTMCASTLDVEGIIEPKPATPLPFTPAHVLGSFLFRGEIATAFSLRKKLAVPVGEDSLQGPFVVARVGEELAAFWVDEVIEVMGEQGVVWQPMPDMLRDRVFDQYAIVRDELILHTSFASLLASDAESIPARWRAAAERTAADKATVAEPQPAGVGTDGGASRDDCSSNAEAEAERAGAGPEGTGDQDERRRPGGNGAPSDQIRAPFGRRDEGTVRSRTGAPVVGMAAHPTFRRAPPSGQHRPTPAHESIPPLRNVPPSGGGGTHGREEYRFRASATESGIASRSSRPAPPAHAAEDRDGGDGHSRAIHAFAVEEARLRSHEFGHASRPAGRETTPQKRRGPLRALALAGTVLVLCAVLVAVVSLWPDSRAPSPSANGKTESRSLGTSVAESVQRPLATESAPTTDRPPQPPPAERVAEIPVAAEPAQSRRIATLESETLSVTIERPRSQVARTTAATAQAGAGKAAPSASQAIATTGIVHVVVRGDTLWEISRKYLGNPFRYPELVRLSGIKNPHLIHPGDIVRIRVSEKRR